MSGRPAVLIDRDGTLIKELDSPPRSASDVRMLPGAAAALARLSREGFALAAITNQSAIARGWLRFEEFLAVQRAIAGELDGAGVRLDGVYFCPHHPREGFAPYRRRCDCRKPGPALVERALRDLNADPARTWMVGDALRDLEAGARVGVRGVLVATGKGAREAAKMSPQQRAGIALVDDLAAAVEHVLASRRASAQGK